MSSKAMSSQARIETALEALIARVEGDGTPPGLAAAVRYAVFPGGARVRPSLCLAVAEACGDDQPGVANAAAAAVELMHCASLVHDDLPCFDDADTRRGKPSVHLTFGEPRAVLAGDALIVLAFDALAQGCATAPQRLAPLIRTVVQGVGLPRGIVSGQAWESETEVDVSLYHQMKTGALFVAATRAGAIAAGQSPAPWTALGDALGAAYQAADDLLDAVADVDEGGKPTGRDVALSRPSLVASLGLRGAYDHLRGLVDQAVASIPDCVGASGLREIVQAQAVRLTPKQFSRSAA